MDHGLGMSGQLLEDVNIADMKVAALQIPNAAEMPRPQEAQGLRLQDVARAAACCIMACHRPFDQAIQMVTAYATRLSAQPCRARLRNRVRVAS